LAWVSLSLSLCLSQLIFSHYLSLVDGHVPLFHQYCVRSALPLPPLPGVAVVPECVVCLIRSDQVRVRGIPTYLTTYLRVYSPT
jgi:hypothetical protein